MNEVELNFKLNFRDGKGSGTKRASGKTAMEAFTKAFKVGLKEEDLGPRITSVDGKEFDTYHYFILDPKTGKRYVPYKRTWYGGKKYLDLRHILLSPEMQGMVIEITLINSRKDSSGSVVRRFDGVFSSFKLEEIANIDMACSCSMGDISFSKEQLLASEAGSAAWVLMLRKQAMLFGGWQRRKMFREMDQFYAAPAMQFGPDASLAPQQTAPQPLFHSQENPISAAEPEINAPPFIHLEPSSPRPKRKPPGRFLLSAQMQSGQVMLQPGSNDKGVENTITSKMQQEAPSATENSIMEIPAVQVTQAERNGEQHCGVKAKAHSAVRQGQDCGLKAKAGHAAQKKGNAPNAKAIREKAASSLSAAISPPSQAGKNTKTAPLSVITLLRAAIFDLDGVVVDSMELHRKSFNELLAPLGISIPAMEFRQRFGGTPAEKVIAQIFAEHGIREDTKEWAKKRNEIYLRRLHDAKLQPIGGFLDFYDMLAANGIKIAVASSGEEQHIAAALDSIGVKGVPIVSIQQVRRGKPAPDLFLLAAKRLKAKKGQVIVFEDAASGLEAAARAKMPAIALSTSLSRRALKGRAALVVANFRSPALKKLFSRLLRRR